jgi:hypothetical protein
MTDVIGATTATKTQLTKSIAQDGGRVEKYEGTISAVDTYVGTLTIGTSTSDGYPLESINVQQQKGKAVATMTYKNWSAGSITAPAGTVFRNSDGAAQSVPIETHPSYGKADSESQGVPVVNGEPKTGVETYQIPSVVYSRTRVESSFTFSESNLVANVGTRNSPAGLSGATANAWLKTGINVQENDEGATVTETWLYAKYGWDTDIYE